MSYCSQIEDRSCFHILGFDGGSRIRDRNGGSCIVLASDSGGWPWLRLQLIVDPDGGSGSWWWIVDYSGIPSWWWILIVVAADCGLWLQQDCLIYNMSTQIPLLTIIHQFIDLQLCSKLFLLINAVNTLIFLMFSVTRGIYCTSVRPGRGIPHMWLSLRFPLSLKVFCLVVFPYSCWGLRTQDVPPC